MSVQPPIVVFANLKGGSGKTTSAAFLAHAFHELGRRVLAVDADPLGVLGQWEALSEQPWPVTLAALPTRDLHKDLPGMIRGRYDAVVIDTPGNVTQQDITMSAMRVATHIVIPIAPSRLEEILLPAMVQLYRDAHSQARVILLINRAVANSNLLAVYTKHYAQFGFEVFRSIVTNRQLFVTAAGQNITNARSTAYGDLAEDL